MNVFSVMKHPRTLQILLLALVLPLVGQIILGLLWPGAWRWDGGRTSASYAILLAFNAVLGIILLTAVPAPKPRGAAPAGRGGHAARARQIRSAVLLVLVEASVLLLYGFFHPERALIVPGFFFLLVGCLILLVVWLLDKAKPGFEWLTRMFLVQFGVPSTILVCAALAFAEVAFPRSWGLGLLAVGVATFLYAVSQFVIVVGSPSETQSTNTGRPASVTWPKSYHESLRLIVNVLVVANGVLLTFLKDGTAQQAGTALPYRVVAIVALAAGVVVGVFHLNVLVGCIDNEYTEKSTTGSGADAKEKTVSYLVVGAVHARASTVLLNLQFYSILVGTALIATAWI